MAVLFVLLLQPLQVGQLVRVVVVGELTVLGGGFEQLYQTGFREVL